ncbi:hypothetical protein TanjilG_07100 [Lupinus angustifolius]|uniref:Protein kinase domain-containing protein n=2 Tax=Lupinus angustifolius TaxID=3871 RepID=A0A4P1QXT8_LUPAN|nr:hypothetical protein TanjilG_07100 [Lupinus angustifolius]
MALAISSTSFLSFPNSLPGDFGFDPLGLGSDAELLKWFAQAELMHSRWAMLGVSGILIPEWLQKIGYVENFSWYDAGSREYFADPTTLFIVQLALMGWVEGRRWADIVNPGSVDIEPKLPHKTNPKPDVGYPGGLWFDPMMWGRGSPEPVMVLRTKEIKNGRLAMLAFLGFCFQATYTGQGPLENLMSHLADPGHNNIFSRSITTRASNISSSVPMAAVRFFPILSILILILILAPFAFAASETESLLRLKQSFTNADTSLSSWIPNVSPCGNWIGVVCFKNIITGLHLSDLGLSGKIDIDALMQIPGLRTISFVNNSFSGPVPEFNKLGAIKAIYLTDNQFSGPIPLEFFAQLGSLKKVWFSNNKFSGNIPDSLNELDLLKELHLENNEFSGKIPSLKQQFTSFSVTNNKLEGMIPENLVSYGANSFTGNEKLCGKPLDRACEYYTLPAEEEGRVYLSGFGIKVILILVFAAIAALVFLSMRNKKQSKHDFSIISRSNSSIDGDQVVQVHVPSSKNSNSSENKSKKGSSHGEHKSETKRASTTRGGSMGDLVMVNDEKGVFGLGDLMKAAAEVLGNGGLGSAYKAAMANGLSVVVKRMREMNKIGRDVFDAEMRQFGRIKHTNILTPLAYHYRREEKLFVTEYMPKGSLLYVLHGDRGTCHADLNWPTRLKIVKGIARGCGFLYNEFSNYELPHGNLKSSNIMLSDDYEPLLSEYAFYPLINPGAVQSMFAYKTTDYTEYQKVSQKTDVYCLGIIILEIITGKFPSQYHSNGKGGIDVVQWVFMAISERREEELIDPELKNSTSSLNNMLQLLQIGAACIESNPEQRITMKEAIRRIEEMQV